jgi:hypothetical protein
MTEQLHSLAVRRFGIELDKLGVIQEVSSIIITWQHGFSPYQMIADRAKGVSIFFDPG